MARYTTEEMRTASREARKAARKYRKENMTASERRTARAKAKGMKQTFLKTGIGDPRKMRVITPKERAERREKIRLKRVAEQFEAPSESKLRRGERKSDRLVGKRERIEIKKAEYKAQKAREAARDAGIGDEIPPEWQEGDFWPEEQTNLMAAHAGEASGGQIKKYGYMGGGKVYGQPRKANYKAG